MSSLERGNKGRPAKKSVASEDERTKGAVPVATSTPLQPKGSKSVGKPDPQSLSNKGRSNAPCCSPISGKPKPLPKHGGKATGEKVKSSKDEMSKAVNHKEEACSPVFRGNTKISDQSVKPVKLTAAKPCSGPSSTRKPLVNQSKVLSATTVKKSLNHARGVPNKTRCEPDRSTVPKDGTSIKDRQTPSIVVEEVDAKDETTKDYVKCDYTRLKGNETELQSISQTQDTSVAPAPNPASLDTSSNVTSGSSDSSKTLSPPNNDEDHTANSARAVPTSSKHTTFYESGRPLSPSIPARRRLSFTPPKEYNSMSFTGRRKSELAPIRGNVSFDVLKRGNNSVDSLKMLNQDLRDQVSRLRGQLDNQRGSIRQTQWQKVVELRHVKEQEQQRLNATLSDQFHKLEKEKQKDMEQLRGQLSQKFESELQKLSRFKDTEISKLKLEVSSKDAMLQRLLGESRHARMKMDIDDRKMRLIDELKQLRQAKKELTWTLENANFAERAFSNNLRRHSETFESEIARVKKEAQAENRQLIEQLKNKDKLISQLEKDLGRHSWGAAAHFAVLERRRSEGAPLPPGGIDLSQPSRTLPEGSDDPDSFRWTPTSIQTPGDVEDAWTNSMEGNVSLGKTDLSNPLKGTKDRSNKGLLEKCRSYLQQNKELSAQNRAFKESTDRATQDSKNTQELLEHSKLQLLQMSRQLNQLKAERGEWELEMRNIEGLRQELVEDKKMINALRKACSDKDRRIELIQHRKKRRRMIETAEKAKIQNAGLKETPFGYEEDDRQVDGNQSVCSLSSTISDDSVWEDVLSREEMERNYQRLMMEQLELQKSHALLQRQTDGLQDPQRENLSKADLQNDLFLSQCRVEQLEHFIREGLQGHSEDAWEGREKLQAQFKSLNTMVKSLEKENKRLQNELTNARDRNEDMEFRLMELEECREKELPCPDADPSPATSTSDKSTEYSPSSPADSVIEEPVRVTEASPMMEQLAKELNALLKDRGRDAESALNKLDCLIDKEKALESMAHELQMKVIALQQEKNSLQDGMLLMKQSQPGKGGHSASLAQAKERQENLALKAEIDSQTRLASERISLQGQVDDLKLENDALKQRIEALINQQHPQEVVKEELIQQCTQPSLQTSPSNIHKANSSPEVSSLSRKSSHRKSKSRDNSDPVTSKRRKNSPNNEEQFKCYQNVGHNIKALTDAEMSQCGNNDNEIGTDTIIQTDNEDIQSKMNRLEHELTSMKNCNDDLIMQLNESAARKMQIESSHQSLQDKLSSMEEGFDLLHKENVALGNQLRQRVEEFQLTQDERSPRVSELEEFCEDLQDRLKDSENCERQLREKIKLFEKTIDEAEINEMAVRERCEQLLAGDYEAKKQIQDLQRTGLELRDIVLEKEIVEQALRDKVDFLQKAEAASVERIEELEGILEDMRQQLDDKALGKTLHPKEVHKMTELKHQITFLETDNRALTSRVAELEENEEILRENWRRVAEEDFNRTQCLEEKVKLLEGLNRELKVKLKDAQEYLVVDMSSVSLAAELQESESKLFDDSSDEDVDDSYNIDDVDSPVKEGSGDSDKKVMREKVRKLERQLSEVAEQKNTKIESLQERLVDLQETEIKLSETISEMEMTERELRAKLALYESSEVTVEKMLKYQSKIEELRTSQESLLDQLEIKEHEGMSLQEKMQEMERTLRGKIVTLEVEMKGYKQKELRNAGHIRDLEKQDKELSDKVTQQAEKENSLYIRISCLMDELKTSKTELESVRKQLEDKDDKVRQAKLLEVKLLEIEMECGKKVSTLNAKLRHREEEFRQKESAYEEQISSLRDMSQHNSQLESEFAQREQNLQRIKIEKDEEIATLTSQISDFQKNSDEFTSRMASLEKELESERVKVCEKETLIDSLKEEIESKVKDMDIVVGEKETEHEMIKSSLQSEIQLKANRVSELEVELKESRQQLSNIEKAKKSELKAAQVIISDLQSFSENCISDVEQKVASKLSVLGAKLESMQSHISELQGHISEQYMNICVVEDERDEQRKMFEEGMLELEKEKDFLETELRSEISSLNVRLEQEVKNKESEQSNELKDSLEREASLRFDVSNLQHQVEQHKHDLIAKLSELEAKNKAHCELSLELSNLRHEHKIVQKELDKSKQACSDMALSLKSVISQKDEQLSQASEEIARLNKVTDNLKMDVDQKENIIDQITAAKDTIIEERNEENKALLEEKSHVENMFTEKCQELDRVNELHLESEKQLVEIRKLLTDKDHVIQKHELEKGEKETKLKETESHAQSIQVDRETLSQELQSVKTVLEGAQSQITRQQQELQLLHTNLQSHQEDIKQLQAIIKEKEEKLQEKDHMYDEQSSELKKLNEQLQDRDQKLEQADCKVVDVELKLQRAENRVRELESMQVSLEMRLEERYAVSQNAEKILRSKELQCDEMESKLDVAEKNLANLKDQISVGDESSKELVQLLESKEVELQQKCSEVSALRDNLADKESLFLSLESKFNQLEVDVESTEVDHSRKNEESKKVISERDHLISSIETKLEKREMELNELSAELESTKNTLGEKERHCEECENQMKHVEESHSELKSKYDNLEHDFHQITEQLDQKTLSMNELQEKTKEKTSELIQYKEQLSKNSQEVTALMAKLEETEQYLSDRKVVIENMTDENQTLKQSVEKLSSENTNVSVREENLNQQLQKEEEKNNALISKLESEISDLTSVNESLRKQSSELQDRTKMSQDELNAMKKDNLVINESIENLSKQLSEIQTRNEELQAKIETLESDVSTSNAEREKMSQVVNALEGERDQLEDDNIQLQKEIEEADKEFQNLTISFEESKNSIEEQVLEISKGKQNVEGKLQAMHVEHTRKVSEITKALEGKNKELEVLKQERTSLTLEKAELTANVESLKQDLKDAQCVSKSAEVDNVEGEIVCESMIAINMAPSLHSTPSPQRLDTADTEKEQLTRELETKLDEVKKNEKVLQKRVGELETVEKELREQIVDIEMTVIVPLENENQDLKDEIGMVKQERDEAISKISKWDDDDESDGHEVRVQESETVHQRLEDALIYGEELEKKNDILLNDIQRLENENDNLSERISDLESSESEKKDEIEHLQVEIDRLNDDHPEASVLEETETTLMDKVLDLEERERNLIRELDSLKKTGTDSEKTWTEVEGMQEKMKYFEQKIQILEDAEGRYMDKIMELEEDKHRLLSELSSITDSHDSHLSQSQNILHSPVNTPSISSSTQTSVPFENDAVLGATYSSDGADSSYHSDTLSSSGQTTSFSADLQKLSVLEDQLQESKAKLEELDARLREKETLVLYLQDKLELLQESEGKLMDKLLEAEEKASSVVHSKYSAQINELNNKIEQIQEENEFLAENVEQYKQSFKEEKEKCNNLQDRLMEDNVNLAELQRTQEELVRTQQMVEDIQSEYEDQLSEHVERANKLQEELSNVVAKRDHLEQIVNAKTKREEELQEQLEGLQSTERELRSRLCMGKTTDDDSAMSDSGVSADDPRIRHEHVAVVEEPIVHRSVKTVQLARSPVPSSSPPPTLQDSEPVPLPRYKRKLRQASIEKISHEELVFLVEDLQDREAALKKRVSDLQAIDESDLSQKVVDLESEKLQLERKLRYVEQQNASYQNPPSKSEEDSHNKFSSGVPLSSTVMLEKPEDVLNQRIKELEGLDKHNKNMVSELERDREVLHEIARKDKATIHDLNVKIRELQLSERSLKEQVSNLEVSESSFFTKCEELEALRVQLEDRVHELEIHERRLRELVRKLKLDEERWLSKSGGMENAVAELSANEAQLKRVVQDMEMEKGGLSERLDYMEARIRELENVEVALLARIKDYENNEVILQNRNVQLENAEAAAHSRASELDVINVNLTQQHKKMVDENAVMAQHLAQLHGQVQELDRRLLSSRDSEIAYKQHVESLQKNESLLQKKVREYELREIDSQSSIRELEQTAEINNDKLAALQRSENRLRYRVQELEGVGGQVPGELTPSQQQKLPQNIEDCQKRIVVLQSQVENLKLQLRQTLNTTQLQSANKSDDEEKEKSNTVSVDSEEYSQLHVKAALLDEYAYQNEELESSHEQLRDTILQLRQGKGACGHEVEIEVCKRRIDSLQTFIRKLKSSLSEGQTTSLLESELDSGPQGETLPARHLQVLESERVLQSVRGLPDDGKAEDTNTIERNGGVHATGLAPVEDSMIQASVAQNMASPPSSNTPEFSNGGQKPEQPTRLEESHWKAIEARKPVTGNDSRGGVNSQPGRGGIKTITSSPRHYGNQPSSTPELEDVTGVLNLHSESELSSYQRTTTQNESEDSCSSPVPPPRKNRANRLSKNMSDDNSSVNNGSGSDRDQPHQQHYSAHLKASANQKHFGDGKSLPLTASNIEIQLSSQQHRHLQHQKTPTPLSRFAEDSFYLPSSTQEGVDSLDDDESPPPLPSQGPPGQDMAMLSGRSSRASMDMDEGRRESLDNSTSGMSIRERIAMIERHLQSDTHTGSNREEEDQLFYWKRKSTENLRQAELLDKNNKFLKEDINRLEKELEEKRRYINTLELWLSSTEDLLRNKNKQTDREMVEQLQLDLSKLRRELTQSGYRSEDATLDAAALKTELEHRDKEISNKRIEIESLAQELRRCHKECRSIEGMRRTALDSLRSLEKELVHLQDAEERLKKSQIEINNLKVQYENKRMDLNSIISEKEELEYGMSKVILERDSFKIDLQKAEKDRSSLHQQVEELRMNLEDLSRVEGKNVKLEDEINNLNSLLVQRNEKIREVYEENLSLRDSVNKSEAELTRFRTLCDDFNNLSARYDEMDQFKNQALSMVQPLQVKVDALTKKCTEKDLLLRRLRAEFKRGISHPSSALDELTRLERAMNGDDYNADNSDSVSDDLSPRPTANHKMRGRSVSMDELSLYSDADSVHMPNTSIPTNIHSPIRRQRPTPYINTGRPRSAEAANNMRSPRRGQDSNSHNTRPSLHHPTRGFDLDQEHFVAIADYDPGLYSQSGWPRLELALREGDQVRVTGPMDKLGYCQAECNGRSGLVPANYLQPIHRTGMNGHHNPHSPGRQQHHPHHHHQPLQQQHHHPHHTPSVIRLNHDIAPPPQFQDNQHYSPNGHLVPDPPHSLHVRGIQDGVLLLAWKPPNLDARGCNKGFQVKGYLVSVDGHEYEQTPNPHYCQATIEGLDPSTAHHLEVQAFCAGGHVSPRAQLVFEGTVRVGEPILDVGGDDDDGDGPLDTDLSAVLNSVHYTKGAKKKVMALYEYNPKDQSPHDYTSFELAFHPGDIISVYGTPRPDGFYHGEMEGKRGLVPACFVEDLATRHGKHGSQDSGHESSKA